MFRLFSKKEEKKLRLEDIKEFVEINTEKELLIAEKKARMILDEVMKEIDNLKKHLKELKEMSSDNSFSDNIKNKYCERCLAMFNFEAPEINYSGLIKFIDTISNIDKSVNNLTVKEFKHMRNFRVRMGNISMRTKVIESKLKALKNSIDGSVIEKKEKIKKCMDWIGDINKKISLLNDEAEEIAYRKQEIEKEIYKLNSELNGFERNGMQEKFDNELAEKEALEKHRDMIKQNIETEFGGLIRPFKKLQYASDSGEATLLSDEKNILEKYLYSSDTFLSDSKLLIRVLINKIRDMSSKNIIELNEKENEKVLTVYGNLNFLVSLKEQYKDIAERIRQREEKIKSIFTPYSDRKHEIKNEIEAKNREIENLENEIKAKNDEIEKLKKKNISNAASLENIINEFLDVDVRISY